MVAKFTVSGQIIFPCGQAVFFSLLILRYKGVSKGGPKPPHILSSCHYVYKQLPQKDVQNLENQERKKQLSGYKQSYTYKNQSLEVSKYMNSVLVACNKLNARG